MPPRYAASAASVRDRASGIEFVADTLRLLAHRIPLGNHLAYFRFAHAPQVLSHRERRVSFFQLRREFAILPRTGRPRQVHPDHQRHHVGVGLPDPVRQLQAPVREPSGACEPRLRVEHGDLRVQSTHVGLRIDLHELFDRLRQDVQLRSLGQWPVCLIAHEAGQGDARTAQGELCLDGPVAQVDQGSLCGKHVVLGPATGAKRGVCHRRLQLRFPDLGGDRALDTHREVGVEPGSRRLASHGQRVHFRGDVDAVRVAQRSLTAKAPLFGAREFLHDPDPRHRHFLAQGPGIHPTGRHVFDSREYLRIG